MQYLKLKQMKNYENLDIEDLENEVWIDILGYDGIYQASSLGRVKSLRREVNTRWGTPRIIEDRILKQNIIKAENGRVDGLIVWVDKTLRSARVIFKAFYPEVDFMENECVMHINKDVLDNRIENLAKATREVSKGVDMVKSVRTIIATPKNLQVAKELNKLYFDNRTHKQCSKCNKVDSVLSFPKGRSVCQNCINNYVIEKRKKYQHTGNEKKCNKCFSVKIDSEFPKLNNTCKDCHKKALKKYQKEQREKLGDYYVKQYGKYNYGYKYFTEELLKSLRVEIQLKRDRQKN